MSKQDFTATILVSRSPEEAFAAINDVRSWWTGDIEGRTDVVGEKFTYSHKDIHRTTHEVTELVPGKRVAWRVTESRLSAFANEKEWDGTEIVFDIARRGDETEVRFTHVGLEPEIECFDRCSRAWSYFITQSLEKRILAGKGASGAESKSAACEG